MPVHQISDYSDAITYPQTQSDINPDRIGIWGSSYSGDHVLCVGAIDRRVKAVISQVPLVRWMGKPPPPDPPRLRSFGE